MPGGLFTPSLFVGALTGAAFGSAAHWLWPNVVPSTGGYVLVGMAAILAGSTHATIAAALMLFEMTGSYDVILPLLAACVIAASVSRALAPESIYTAPLKRSGVELPRIARPAWMQRTGVRSLVRADAPRVEPQTRLGDVVKKMALLGEGDDLFVVDADGALRGVISLDTLREVLADLPDLDLVVAADVMERAGAVSVDASLWEVDAACARHRVDAPAGGVAARGQSLRRHARHPRRPRRRAPQRHLELGAMGAVAAVSR